MPRSLKSVSHAITLTTLVLAAPALLSACGDDNADATTASGDDSETGTSADPSAGTTAGGTMSGSSAGPSGSESDSMTGQATSDTTSASTDSTVDPSAGSTGQATTGDPTTGDPTTDPTTTGGVEYQPVRFIAMGDGGEGNDNQYQVANTLEMLCPEIGCDFVLYLGDNFYDEGVDGVTDTQFATKFEEPYADLEMPFYIVFGNHDYGLIANNWGKADYQIDYSAFSDKWTLPAPWYDFEVENTHFFALDSSRIFWDYQWDQQLEWLQQGTANSGAPWKFAFGHHPYISNGAHGNAGNYEGLPFPIPLISGEDVKDFMEDGVCGDIDVYFCGHDHNRQWLEPACGTEFVVSGAAAKYTDLEHHDDQPTLFEDDQEPGFLWVEIDGDTLTGRFYDADGNIDFERTIQK
jgi:hypothetical protein